MIDYNSLIGTVVQLVRAPPCHGGSLSFNAAFYNMLKS